MIMCILERCMKRNALVYTVKEGYELGDNIQSKVMAFAFGLSAEIERDLISQRTKEALARIKSQGGKLGRSFGCKNKFHKLGGQSALVSKLVATGISKRKIARKLKVSPPTLTRFINDNINTI